MSYFPRSGAPAKHVHQLDMGAIAEPELHGVIRWLERKVDEGNDVVISHKMALYLVRQLQKVPS